MKKSLKKQIEQLMKMMEENTPLSQPNKEFDYMIKLKKQNKLINSYEINNVSINYYNNINAEKLNDAIALNFFDDDKIEAIEIFDNKNIFRILPFLNLDFDYTIMYGDDMDKLGLEPLINTVAFMIFFNKKQSLEFMTIYDHKNRIKHIIDISNDNGLQLPLNVFIKNYYNVSNNTGQKTWEKVDKWIKDVKEPYTTKYKNNIIINGLNLNIINMFNNIEIFQGYDANSIYSIKYNSSTTKKEIMDKLNNIINKSKIEYEEFIKSLEDSTRRPRK